jgi:LAO/AO transport system kinase
LRTEKELEALLSLAMRPDSWQPPIVKTIATENKGLADLAAAIESYREFQQREAASPARREAIARWRILELLRERLLAQTLGADSASERLDRLAVEVAAKRRDPYSAVEEIMNAVVSGQ